MKIVLLGAALALSAVTTPADVRHLKHDPAAKFYVLDAKVADDVRVCIAIPEDKTFACQSAKELRETYRLAKPR